VRALRYAAAMPTTPPPTLHTDPSRLRAGQLSGFFVGWPDPPTPDTHLRILEGAHVAVVAQLPNDGAVVGFATALSDGVLSAYVPLLEVLPAWQGHGLGRRIMQRMFAELEGIYMVDLVCDPDLEAFYAPLGLRRLPLAMGKRDYGAQSGRRG
jgi:GNAT superfamily N-acetyltransferase